MIVRSYKLKIYPNYTKAEALRYAMWFYRAWVLDYAKKYYVGGKTESTESLGVLANQAQYRARHIVRNGFAAEKATGRKFECPKNFPLLCQGIIRSSKTNTFSYWVKTPLGPWVPVKSHRGLNCALRAGGELTGTCDVKLTKSGQYVAIVFVQFKVQKAIDSGDYLGCDVGVNAGVARSDGYIGKSLRPILERTRQKRAEQQRQGHQKTSARSAVKQFLDREAKRTVASARRGNKTLVLEARRQLGNLKPTGRIGGWTRRHFGERIRQIAEISVVAVREVSPAYSSVTCLRCNHRDKANRRGIDFRCRQCGFRSHADVLAARNLVRRATGAFVERNKVGV
jgi:hypothetical protein